MIAVVISAKTEWRVVTNHYSVEHLKTTPFGECFTVSQDGEELGFFFGGWGKIDAAASTQHLIDLYRPELMINIGTCGGFAGRVKAGDILLADKTIVYDIYERMFDSNQAIAAYTTEIDLAWVDDIPNKPANHSTLVSADRDLDPKEIERLHLKYGAIAGDWELGAIAHICKRNKVPVLIARGVSDVVNVHDGEAYANPDLFIRRTEGIMKALLSMLPEWISMYRKAIR